jgi:hypothetical protein
MELGIKGPHPRILVPLYLGRMFDLHCERDRAVEYYQQAVKAGDATAASRATKRAKNQTIEEIGVILRLSCRRAAREST